MQHVQQLYGTCRELGYCSPMCGLCAPIALQVERKLLEPKIVRPRRARGRPPRRYSETGKLLFQISLSYYRSYEDLDVRVVQRGFMDEQEEI